MSKNKPATIAEAQQFFTPGGASAFDRIMASAKEFFPQPVAQSPAQDEPWNSQLDKLVAEAPDLAPDASVCARIELLRARQVQLQGWMVDRTSIWRNRGLEAHLVGVESVEFQCRSCGRSWLLLAGVMPTDAALTCPNSCNRIG